MIQFIVGLCALLLGLIMAKLSYDWWTAISHQINDAISQYQRKRLNRLLDRAMYAQMATGLAVTWCMYSMFIVVMAALEHFGMAEPLW